MDRDQPSFDLWDKIIMASPREANRISGAFHKETWILLPRLLELGILVREGKQKWRSFYSFGPNWPALVAATSTAIEVHWINPWADAIPVPIEELAQALSNRPEELMADWSLYGETLDAYVLPQTNIYQSWYNVGVRYGDRGDKYISPDANGRTTQIRSLLARHPTLV